VVLISWSDPRARCGARPLSPQKAGTPPCGASRSKRPGRRNLAGQEPHALTRCDRFRTCALTAVLGLALVASSTAFLAPALAPSGRPRGARLGLSKLRAEAGPDPSQWVGPGNPFAKKEVYKPNYFDDVVEDAVNKRFGAGQAFYGESERLKAKDYDDLALQAEADASMREVREVYTLVVGSSSLAGEWCVLKALNKELELALLTPDFDETQLAFGTDGANVDIYFGDITDAGRVANAMRGATTVVYAEEGALPIGPRSHKRMHLDGLSTCIEAARAAGSVRRIVLVTSAADALGGSLRWKREGEALLRASGLPYAIVRAPAKLVSTDQSTAGIALCSPAAGAAPPPAASVTALDLAEVVATLLLMDEIAAKADARGARPLPCLRAVRAARGRRDARGRAQARRRPTFRGCRAR